MHTYCFRPIGDGSPEQYQVEKTSEDKLHTMPTQVNNQRSAKNTLLLYERTDTAYHGSNALYQSGNVNYESSEVK